MLLFSLFSISAYNLLGSSLIFFKSSNILLNLFLIELKTKIGTISFNLSILLSISAIVDI